MRFLLFYIFPLFQELLADSIISNSTSPGSLKIDLFRKTFEILPHQFISGDFLQISRESFKIKSNLSDKKLQIFSIASPESLSISIQSQELKSVILNNYKKNVKIFLLSSQFPIFSSVPWNNPKENRFYFYSIQIFPLDSVKISPELTQSFNLKTLSFFKHHLGEKNSLNQKIFLFAKNSSKQIEPSIYSSNPLELNFSLSLRDTSENPKINSLKNSFLKTRYFSKPPKKYFQNSSPPFSTFQKPADSKSSNLLKNLFHFLEPFQSSNQLSYFSSLFLLKHFPQSTLPSPRLSTYLILKLMKISSLVEASSSTPSSQNSFQPSYFKRSLENCETCQDLAKDSDCPFECSFCFELCDSDLWCSAGCKYKDWESGYCSEQCSEDCLEKCEERRCAEGCPNIAFSQGLCPKECQGKCFENCDEEKFCCPGCSYEGLTFGYQQNCTDQCKKWVSSGCWELCGKIDSCESGCSEKCCGAIDGEEESKKSKESEKLSEKNIIIIIVVIVVFIVVFFIAIIIGFWGYKKKFCRKENSEIIPGSGGGNGNQNRHQGVGRDLEGVNRYPSNQINLPNPRPPPRYHPEPEDPFRLFPNAAGVVNQGAGPGNNLRVQLNNPPPNNPPPPANVPAQNNPRNDNEIRPVEFRFIGNFLGESICSICLAGFSVDSLTCKMPCRHIFCLECLNQHRLIPVRGQRCPNCNFDISRLIIVQK